MTACFAGKVHRATLTFVRGLLPVAENRVKRRIAAPICGQRGVPALMIDVVSPLLTDADA